MISESSSESTSIAKSKIIYKSQSYHPLTRFVSEDTVALMFNINPQQIYRIECWKNIVYVYAQGVSRFVSYADFPPIVGVSTPSYSDFQRWRKRWYKRWHCRLAPEFWTKFFAAKFKQANSRTQRRELEELIAEVRLVMSETELQKLRKLFSPEKYWLANF